MGNTTNRVGISHKEDVVDILRNLGQAYREDQKISGLQLLLKQITAQPDQKEVLKQVALRENTSISIFAQIFRSAQATFNVTMKQLIVDLVLQVATGDDVLQSDQEALVEAGVSQLTLDVFAFSKAYKAPLSLIEHTISLVDLFVPFDTFAEQFVSSGGSKILFSQLIMHYPTDVPRQKAIKALRHLAQSSRYLKHMSESGGVSALIKSLTKPNSNEFVIDALKIITTLCRNNSKLLGQILEAGSNVHNILHLLSLNDKFVIQETVFILDNLTKKEKYVTIINQHEGFKYLNDVLCSPHVRQHPTPLIHTVSSLAALMTSDDNRQMFVDSGNMKVLQQIINEYPLYRANNNVGLGGNSRSPSRGGSHASRPSSRTSSKPDNSSRPASTTGAIPERTNSIGSRGSTSGIHPVEKNEDKPPGTPPVPSSPAELSSSPEKNLEEAENSSGGKDDATTASETDSIGVIEDTTDFNNPIQRACLKLIQRLAESEKYCDEVGQEFAVGYILQLIGSVSNEDMGIFPAELYPTADAIVVVGSVVSQPPQPSATAPQVYEIMVVSMGLLALLCRSNRNHKAIPGHDKFQKLLNYLHTSSDARSVRLAMAVLRVLEVLIKECTLPKEEIRRLQHSHGINDPNSFGQLIAPVVGMVIITSLCEIVEGVQITRQKYGTQPNSVPYQTVALALRILLKIASWPDQLALVFEHLPGDCLKRLMGLPRVRRVLKGKEKERVEREKKEREEKEKAAREQLEKDKEEGSREGTPSSTRPSSSQRGGSASKRTAVIKEDTPLPDMVKLMIRKFASDPAMRLALIDMKMFHVQTEVYTVSIVDGGGAQRLQSTGSPLGTPAPLTSSNLDALSYSPQSSRPVSAIQSSDCTEGGTKKVRKRKGKIRVTKSRTNIHGEVEEFSSDETLSVSEEEIDSEEEEAEQRRMADIAFAEAILHGGKKPRPVSASEKIARQLQAGVTKHTVQHGETMFEIAQAHMGHKKWWTELLRPDMTNISEVDGLLLEEGDVIMIPKPTYGWLTDAERQLLKRTRSAPELQSRTKKIVQHAQKLTNLDVKQEEVHRRDTEAARMLKANMTRLNRDYLLAQQDTEDQEQKEWEDLQAYFKEGVFRVRDMMEDRIEFCDDAIEKRDTVHEAELDARNTIALLQVIHVCEIQKIWLKKIEEHNWEVIKQVNQTAGVQRGKRRAVEIEEMETRHRMAAIFKLGKETYFNNHRERMKVARSETDARGKFVKHREQWLFKVQQRRQLFEVENDYYLKRTKLIKERVQDVRDMTAKFHTEQRVIMSENEESQRQHIIEKWSAESVYWAIKNVLLQTEVDEKTERTALELPSLQSQVELQHQFATDTIVMLQMEETKHRAHTTREYEKSWVHHWHTWKKYGVEAREYMPRKQMVAESLMVLTKVFKRCVSESMVLLQEDETKHRDILLSNWVSFAMTCAFQLQRLHQIREERLRRTEMTNQFLQVLKGLHRKGKAAKIEIALRDVVMVETPNRHAILKEEEDCWWEIRFKMVIYGEAVARKIVERLERKEYTRVGRGLSDYLHMLDLDRTAALFDYWNPNEYLLVPFIVPKPAQQNSNAIQRKQKQYMPLTKASQIGLGLRPRDVQPTQGQHSSPLNGRKRVVDRLTPPLTGPKRMPASNRTNKSKVNNSVASSPPVSAPPIVSAPSPILSSTLSASPMHRTAVPMRVNSWTSASTHSEDLLNLDVAKLERTVEDNIRHYLKLNAANDKLPPRQYVGHSPVQKGGAPQFSPPPQLPPLQQNVF